MLKKILLAPVVLFALLIIGLNVWGIMSLGTITPDPNAPRDDDANRVVMVFGASGSAGDGVLKGVVDDPSVEKIYVVTRRSTPRIDAGVAAGRIDVRLHEDFEDYSTLAAEMAEVNTVLWALGTSSLQVDGDTYTWIHVDFPTAFVEQWLQVRTEGPMAFHYVTGMGTGEDESARWAQDKGRAERLVAEMAEGTGLRTFGHRSGWIRPPSESANAVMYFGEWLLTPGDLVIPGKDLGQAMLEISARDDLPNGTIVDNRDAILYAQLYKQTISTE